MGEIGQARFRTREPQISITFSGWSDESQVNAAHECIAAAGRAECVAGTVRICGHGRRATWCAGRGVCGWRHSAVAARWRQRPSRARCSSDGCRARRLPSSRCLRDPRHYEELVTWRERDGGAIHDGAPSSRLDRRIRESGAWSALIRSGSRRCSKRMCSPALCSSHIAVGAVLIDAPTSQH